MQQPTRRGRGTGRRGAIVLAVATAIATVAAACAPPPAGVRTNWLGDERWDLGARPKGAIAVIGDSVGYGLTTVGYFTDRLVQDGWGPMRSYTQLGLHASSEKPMDPDTVIRWIGEFRARGLEPRVVVVISGSNDVGYPAANDVNRNKQRIESALAALGNVQVVWTTIHHNRPDLMTAWNRALWEVDARYGNLHVCDWAAYVVANPQYLERDKVHMTVGPTGGYAAMREFVAACARAIP